MNYYLKKINLNMSDLEYDMYQEIPKEETGAENEANGLTFIQFKEFLKKKNTEENEQLSNKTTPKITYIMYVNNYPVGEVTIRPKLNNYWLEHSGNIGYKIRPSERRKGYGKAILKLALSKCEELGINEPLLQCNNKNYASKKIIESSNGIIVRKVDNTNYYKIKL